MVIYIFILILLVFVYQYYHVKEGINFTRKFFLDNYDKNNIILDKKNETLEKNGKIIGYKKINNSKLGNINMKPITNQLLQQHDIPISKSYIWNDKLSTDENLFNIQDLKFPLVVKPNHGEKGRYVTTNIMTTAELLHCVNDLKKRKKIAYIEEQATGKEYRIMVLHDTIIGITMKTAPFIIGDGIHTVDELINNYNKKIEKYKIHTIDYNFIQQQGYTSSDIIPLGEKIIVTNVKNMSNGSTITYVDINTVHPINISLFKKINHILDLKLSGIDYICEDLSIPYYVNGCVIEVNPKPGLEIHYDVYPENEKNDLLNTIIDNVFYPVTV
jgi:cyanophycin synthetase